jgi:hypothetical protein
MQLWAWPLHPDGGFKALDPLLSGYFGVGLQHISRPTCGDSIQPSDILVVGRFPHLGRLAIFLFAFLGDAVDRSR